MFTLDKEDTLYQEVTYEGIKYQVLNSLSHELLLVVSQEELEKGEFPLKPVIIPDISLIKARSKM